MELYSVFVGACACALTSLAFGLTVLKALRLRLNRLEYLCIGYILGSAIVSTCSLALALLMLARKGVYLSLAALSLPLLFAGVKRLRRCEPFNGKFIPRSMQVIFALGFLAYTALYVRQALTPDISADAMTYHLGFVNLWNHTHVMQPLPDMYAGMPQGMEMRFYLHSRLGGIRRRI
jgi:hypothetical protein